MIPPIQWKELDAMALWLDVALVRMRRGHIILRY
jgi:hypothetical protein